jgi:hypothetical protein
MISSRSLAIVARHAYQVWRAGQIRFRLETVGLYYPALPYQSPWWRFPLSNAVLLLQQSRSYASWVVEMESLQREGPTGWWDAQYPNRKDSWYDE